MSLELLFANRFAKKYGSHERCKKLKTGQLAF